MSAIASFIKMPKTALDGLREATVPKKSLFGTPRDVFPDYLRKHGRDVSQYEWSGYVLATLLPYLAKEHQIDLMKSEHRELSAFLAQAREATYFIFTTAHKQAYLAKLDGQFSEEKLRDYYNKFNASNEAEVGKPMLDGVDALKQSLSALDEGSVIVLSIG